MGLIAIPTTRNSVVSSIRQKAAKYRNGLKTLRKFADFQAEYEGSIPFTRSSFSTTSRHHGGP